MKPEDKKLVAEISQRVKDDSNTDFRTHTDPDLDAFVEQFLYDREELLRIVGELQKKCDANNLAAEIFCADKERLEAAIERVKAKVNQIETEYWKQRNASTYAEAMIDAVDLFREAIQEQ